MGAGADSGVGVTVFVVGEALRGVWVDGKSPEVVVAGLIEMDVLAATKKNY